MRAWRNADPELLKTCFLNLMINAADAMPAGGTLTVSLAKGAQGAHDALVVTVQDTGHGMTPEEIATAFEPYFSTKETGLGIGLALTQGVKAYDDAAKATGRAGAAAEISGARTKGLAGAVEAARNSVETLQLVIGQKLLPILTPLVRRFAAWAGGLAESESFQRPDRSVTAVGSMRVTFLPPHASGSSENRISAATRIVLAMDASKGFRRTIHGRVTKVAV